MKAKLKNLLTGEIIDVYSTTDSVDSSYGLECWVDGKGNSYGQCQFGAPTGFELVECDTDPAQFINPGFVKNYFSALGKKGGSSRTPAKKSASAANLDAARKAGKTGGWPKNRPREYYTADRGTHTIIDKFTSKKAASQAIKGYLIEDRELSKDGTAKYDESFYVILDFEKNEII